MKQDITPQEVTPKELRQFALVFGGIVIVIFGLVFPFLFSLQTGIWPYLVAAAVVFPGLVAPILLKGFYYQWIKFGNILGWINSRIILTLVFYVLFFPMGIIFSLFGWDPLRRKRYTDRESYRQMVEDREPDHMERPY